MIEMVVKIAGGIDNTFIMSVVLATGIAATLLEECSMVHSALKSALSDGPHRDYRLVFRRKSGNIEKIKCATVL